MDKHTMKRGSRTWIVQCVVIVVVLSLNACAMVDVSRVKTHDYVNEQRADVIGTGRLSDRTVQALNVVALTVDSCQRVFTTCTDTVAHSPGLNDEQQLSALAELWLDKAIKIDKAGTPMADQALDAYL